MLSDSELFERVKVYASRRNRKVEEHEKLGYGSDGTVWETEHSGIKAVHRWDNYYVERVSYQRLAAADVNAIGPFAVPRLIDFDDDLKIVEMEIVDAPYTLDFGKVYIDYPPAYWSDPQLKADTHAEWRARFDDHWSQVAGAIYALERHGIYYVDPREANIDTTGL